MCNDIGGGGTTASRDERDDALRDLQCASQ